MLPRTTLQSAVRTAEPRAARTERQVIPDPTETARSVDGGVAWLNLPVAGETGGLALPFGARHRFAAGQ
jgi:hypothetical protein